MRKVTRTAPAKINLGLDVTGTRPDGYHLLETVFQAVSIADTVTVELIDTPDIALTCDVAGVPVRKILPGKRRSAIWMLPG